MSLALHLHCWNSPAAPISAYFGSELDPERLAQVGPVTEAVPLEAPGCLPNTRTTIK